MTRKHPPMVRSALLGLLIAAGAAPAGDAVQWRADYNAARKEAADRGLPLLLCIGSEDCMYCVKMEATTFKDPAVALLVNGQFVPLKVDATREPALAQALKVQVYPTTVLASPDGKIHAFLQGYVSSEQLTDHAKRAVLATTTPDWVARDLEAAGRAVASSDFTRGVSLLKGIVSDAKDSPAKTKAKQLLVEVEQQAADRLARATGLEDKGETTAAAEALSDLMRRYAGTAAANDAASRLAGHADKLRVRSDRSRDLLAQARDDFRGGRLADCLDRCEQVTARYADLPEAADAVALASQVKADPDRLAKACDQLNERTAATYLALADAWQKKGQPKEAMACLEKVSRIAPGSRQAEAADLRLAKIKNETDALQAGFGQKK
jgi:thioredoxin-like negative regulator of GroEL